MSDSDRGSTCAMLLRVTVGVIVLATWVDNLDKGLYTADGLTSFLDSLFDAENGNASSLTAYKGLLDTVLIPVAGIYGGFQLVLELLVGLGLLLGAFTRLFSLIAAVFFFNLILVYFGAKVLHIISNEPNGVTLTKPSVFDYSDCIE